MMHPATAYHSASRLLALATLGVICALTPHAAMAHGGNPLPRDVRVLDEGSWLLLTNFGVLTSDHPDRYVCEEIFLGGLNFQVVPFDTQTWLTISADQLARTTNGGCSFEKLATREVNPSALAQSDSGEHVVWLTNGLNGESLLEQSEDRGDTIKTLDLKALGKVRWTAVHFASERSLYLAGYSEALETRGIARIFSMNLDTEEFEQYPGWEDVTYPYIFDVHDGALAGLASVKGELSLLWDLPARAIETRTILEDWPVDMSISADGKRLAVAGAVRSGSSVIFTRDMPGDTLTRAPFFAADPSACIAWFGEDVAFCAKSSAQDFALALGDEQAATRATLVDFQQLKGPRDDCPADSPLQKSCSLVWPELARALRIELPGDQADMGSAASDMGMPMVEDMAADMMVNQEMPDLGTSTQPPDMTSSPIDDEESCSQINPSNKGNDENKLLYLLTFMAGFLLMRARRRQ